MWSWLATLVGYIGQNVACFFSFLGEVHMPSGKVAKPDITDNKDGTVTVRYAPTEAGLHEMDIRYDNMHIPGNTSNRLVVGEFVCSHLPIANPTL